MLKTWYFTLIVLFKLENDYKRVSFVIFFLSRDTLLFVTLVLVKLRFRGNSTADLSKNLQDPRKTKL